MGIENLQITQADLDGWVNEDIGRSHLSPHPTVNRVNAILTYPKQLESHDRLRGRVVRFAAKHRVSVGQTKYILDSNAGIVCKEVGEDTGTQPTLTDFKAALNLYQDSKAEPIST